MKSKMTEARFEEIRATYQEPMSGGVRMFMCGELVEALTHAIAEIERGREAYAKLAACVGALDFDRSESAPPQTQEQWFEFVRGLDDRAQALIEAEETERDREHDGGEAS